MTGSRSTIALVVTLLAMLFGGTARAQDLSAGKTPEQLFRLNCAMCHKSPQGLAATGDKAGGLFGLQSFLAEHYTGSSQSAAAIAGYLKSVDSAAAPHRGSRLPRRKAAGKTGTAKKTDKPAKVTNEKAVKPKADKPAADKPTADKSKMVEPKSAGTKSAKKKAAAHSEAKRGKPKAEKKTD